MTKTQKQKTWEAMSRYVRLKDALEYCKRRGIDLSQFDRPEDVIGECVTCGAVKSWSRMDCGHCISRGLGGSSGVYFHECNVGLQCKKCNAFRQGARPEFEEHLKKKYGDGIIEELERQHRAYSYGVIEIVVLEEHFKKKYKELVKEYRL